MDTDKIITRKKAISIGFITGLAITAIGFILISSSGLRFNVTSINTKIGFSLISLGAILYQVIIDPLLHVRHRLRVDIDTMYLITIFAVPLFQGIVCAAVGGLFVLVKDKLKWKKEVFIPFFIVKIVAIYMIVNLIAVIILKLFK